MASVTFRVENIFCYECANAIRKFIGSMKGILSVDVVDEGIRVNFDEGLLTEESVKKLVSDTVQRLGYRISE
jgi:copper chaperone CopZ